MLKIDQMALCNVKGDVFSDEPKENSFKPLFWF